MNIDIRIVEAIVLKLGDDYLNQSNIYLSYVYTFLNQIVIQNTFNQASPGMWESIDRPTKK